MSKVLVDRELLDSAATWLEVHAPGGGCVEGSVASDLRELLAQPAEADGVEVVGYRVVAGSEMLFDVYEEALRYTDEDEPEQLMTVAQHLAALSAVTAERDRLRKDAERYRWASSGVHEAETLVSIVNCHGGYAEKVAERVDVYREAAMAAKEA